MSRYEFNRENPLNFYLIKQDLLQHIQASRKKITWIWGESGCGKSLFASIFYDSISVNKIWIDVERNEASVDSVIRKIKLHLQTGTRTGDKPVCIFIDDTHRLNAISSERLRQIISICPESSRLCVISQKAPNQDHIPLIKNDEIEEIPPALLHFTLNETIDFCKQQGKPLDDELIRTHQRYNGLPLAIASHFLASGNNPTPLPEIIFLRSAQWEEAQGNTLAALALYVKSKQLDRFAKLFLCNARHWFASGQRENIGDVLSLISDTEKDRYPWCWIWESLLTLPTNPDQARKTAEHAFQLFKQKADLNGMYLSISHALLTYLVKLSDFGEIRHLLYELSKFDTDVSYATLDRHAKSSVSYVIYFCMFLVTPENRHLQRWEQRTLSALVSETEIVPKLKMQVLIQKAYMYRGDNYKIHPLETLIEIGNEKPVQPYDIINYNLARIQEYWCSGQFDKIKKIYRESIEIITANNMQANVAHTSLQVVIALLLNNELEQAKKEIYHLIETIPRHMSALLHHLYALETWRQALLGEHVLAMNTARQCSTISKESGCTAYLGFSYIVEAYACALAGNVDDAKSKLDALAGERHLGHYEIFYFHADLLNSYIAFTSGNQLDATSYALSAIEFAARKNLSYFIWLMPSILAHSVSLSLEAGHQTGYCIKLIETLNLTPPEYADSENSWYWPVVIRTLGGLDTNIESLNKPGKSRRIQLLIIYLSIIYADSGVPLEILYDTLWPNEDASSARHKLDNALYRLRQTLGKHSVSIINGNVKLETQRIWVDAICLQHAIKACNRALQRNSEPADIMKKIHEIIHLYRGEFLQGVIEPVHDITGFRAHLANQVTCTVTSAYRHLAGHDAHKGAFEQIQSHLEFIENGAETRQTPV